MREIVVVGAGGFGREVVDLLEDINRVEPTYELLGVIDDGPAADDLERLAERRLEHLGPLDRYLEDAPPAEYVIAIANPAVREKLDARLTEAGHTAAVLVHPAATVGSRVTLGPGTILCAGARLTTNVLLGRHVHVNLNATVGHDTTLGAYVTVYPSAAVSGSCTLADKVSMGVGSAILQGLSIGEGTFVGAAALVTKDLPAGLVVKGVPAR